MALFHHGLCHFCFFLQTSNSSFAFLLGQIYRFLLQLPAFDHHRGNEGNCVGPRFVDLLCHALTQMRTKSPEHGGAHMPVVGWRGPVVEVSLAKLQEAGAKRAGIEQLLDHQD